MVIKERLGHKDIWITLNTYGHLYPSEQKELAEMLDDIMRGEVIDSPDASGGAQEDFDDDLKF